MKKAVIYARQSFGLEENALSVEMQIANCKQWAKQNGYNIAGIYSDSNTSSELYPACQAGMSAARIDAGFQRWQAEQRTKGRKEFKQGLGEAFDRIACGGVDAIIVNTTNRLGRTAYGSFLMQFITSYLMEHRCSIVDASNNSCSDFSDRMMMLFSQLKDGLDYMSVAEKRRQSIEAIDKRINEHRVYSNAFAVVMDNGNVTFDSAKADVVRYIYNGVLDGMAYNQMLKTLNTTFRALCEGKQWRMCNLYSILSNLVYTGYSKDRAGEVARAINTPEPIISYSDYLKVQGLMQTRKDGKGVARARGKHFLPLSGLLKCGECGRRLTVRFDDGVVYRCDNPDGHKTWVRMQGVLESLQGLFIVHLLESARALRQSSNRQAEAQSIKDALEAKKQSLKAKMRLVETDEDFELFKEEIAEIKADISRLQMAYLDAQSKCDVDAKAEMEQIEQDFHKLMECETLDEDTYRRLLRATIAEILVYEDKMTVKLTDGNAVDLPRMIVDRRGKKVLPKCNLLVATEAVETLDSITHYTIQYKANENKTLVENDIYTIELIAE